MALKPLQQHTYTITAGIGDEPMWTLNTHTTNGGAITATDNITELVDHILTTEAA